MTTWRVCKEHKLTLPSHIGEMDIHSSICNSYSTRAPGCRSKKRQWFQLISGGTASVQKYKIERAIEQYSRAFKICKRHTKSALQIWHLLSCCTNDGRGSSQKQ